MSMPEFVVCRSEPSIASVSGLFVLIFQRDSTLTSLIADETKMSCELLAVRVAQFTEKRLDLEWKLPVDPESRFIEYMGVPTRYSKIRFGILRAIIMTNGKPVPYDVIAQAGWGALIDRDILEDTIYQFNRFFKTKGIPKFLRCHKEHVILEPLWSGEEQKQKSSDQRGKTM